MQAQECEHGLGQRAAIDSQSAATPLPVPPPQGGREPCGTVRRKAILAFALFLVVVCIASATCWILSLGPAPRGEGLAYSTMVVDREGRLLRPYTTPEGRWRLPATRADVDPRFFDIDATENQEEGEDHSPEQYDPQLASERQSEEFHMVKPLREPYQKSYRPKDTSGKSKAR